MTRNMGSIDRVLRTVIGLALVGFGIVTHNWWGAIGVIFLATAAAGRCPAYVPFGLKTCKTP